MIDSDVWFAVHTDFDIDNFVFNVPASFTSSNHYQVEKEADNGDIFVVNCMMANWLAKEYVDKYGFVYKGLNPKDVDEEWFARLNACEAKGIDELLFDKMFPLRYYW